MKKFAEQVDLYLDGELSDDACAAMYESLRHSGERRKLFVRKTMIHSALRDQLVQADLLQTMVVEAQEAGDGQETISPALTEILYQLDERENRRDDDDDDSASPPPAQPVDGDMGGSIARPGRRQAEDRDRRTRYIVIPKPLFYGMLAAAMVLISVTIYPLLSSFSRRGAQDATSHHVAAAPARENPSVALAHVQHSLDAVWEDWKLSAEAGTELSKGTYRLESGSVQLAMRSGASVIVEAPAAFEIISTNELSMTRGKITAHVPAQARGFTVRAGSVRVVDLGTEFGLDLSARHDAEVHVFDGVVEAGFAAGGANPADAAVSRRHLLRLTGGSARRFDFRSNSVEDVRVDASRFARSWDQVLARPRALNGRIVYFQAAPGDLDEQMKDSDGGIMLFCERAGVTLRHPIEVSAAGAGSYDSGSLRRLDADARPTVAAGTRVFSYLIRLGRMDEGSRSQRWASVTFPGRIVGVLTSGEQLAATDAELGAPGTRYFEARDPAGRGIEGKRDRDAVSIKDGGSTMEMLLRTIPAAGDFVDELRVLVEVDGADSAMR